MQAIRAAQMKPSEAQGRLSGLVEKHGVCYEVWPIVQLVNSRQVKVGFELQLCGVNEDGACHLCPGCPRCKATFADLREIAESVLPRQGGAVRCEVRSYDVALHGSRKRGFRPEVILCIAILHRAGFDQPIDSSEESCLKQMCGRLSELGVRAGNWYPSGEPIWSSGRRPYTLGAWASRSHRKRSGNAAHIGGG